MAADSNNKDKADNEPDFSKDSTLEYHNKQNLKDLNSEASSSKASEGSEKAQPDEDGDIDYKSHSVSKTSVRDRQPRLDTGHAPEE
ncbi:MAG TPA: hypothetical protein VFR70_02020 [Flavobacterium sp.]|nr:hypothetical protein [Flavobacterium sp.]